MAALADRLAKAELRASQGWIAAETLIEQRIDAILKRHGVSVPGQKPTSPLPPEMTELRRVSHLLKRRILGGTIASVVPAGLYSALCDAVATQEALAHQYEAQFAEAQTTHVQVIRQVASHELLRQAVAWQNHGALATALSPLAGGSDMPLAKRRQREDLVVNYLQRYCVKNDTIGFFGPVAWGRIEKQGDCLSADPAHDLIAKRNVYFEDWAIAALAEAVASDTASTPWLTPRLMPYLRIDGTRLVFPGGETLPLEKSDSELLRACTGKRTSHQMARSILVNPFSCFRDASQIFTALRKLELAGRIELRFPLPTCEARPERALRAHFDAIEDAPQRAKALTQLARLESAKQAVASAESNAETLCDALCHLDAEFESITGASARRRLGEAYGGRSLVYEDCVRGMKVQLGETLLSRLQPSLDLVLMSSRWFTSTVARRYREELRRTYRQLVDASSGAAAGLPVDLPTFWQHTTPLFFEEGRRQIQDIVHDLTTRWMSILPPLASSRSVSVSVESIRQASIDAFSTTLDGWARARHQSPDLMLCGIRADRPAGSHLPVAVLGEIHVGYNTLLTNGFVWQHPNPPEFLAARRTDLGAYCVAPKVSPEGIRGFRRPIRTQWVDDASFGTEVLFSEGASPSDPQTAIPIAELAVTEVDGRVLVRHRSKDWQCDPLELFGDFISLTIASEFRFIRPAQHIPRVSVGGIVWQRETWIIPCSDLQFLHSANYAESFFKVRRLAAALALPNYIFVRVPWENKPFFVDLQSPQSVRQLAKQIRGAIRNGVDPSTGISVSEMLPSFEDLWLRDAEGRTYTSELRMVAIHRDDAALGWKHA